MTNSNTLNKVGKWAIAVVAAIVFAVLQGDYGFMKIHGVKPLFMLPLVVGFSMFRKQTDSCIFGILCGAMLDFVSSRIFGFSSLCFMAIGVASSLLTEYLIKTNVINSLILTSGATLVYYLLDFTFRYLIIGSSGAFKVFLVHIIPTVLYTIIITPLIYWPCRFYHERLDNLEQ